MSIFRWTRIRFDKVAGVSSNALAVGARLDAFMLASWRLASRRCSATCSCIADVDEYNQMLSSLAGEGYAELSAIIPSLGLRYNDLAIEATELWRCRADRRDARLPWAKPDPLSGVDSTIIRISAGRDPASGISARRFTSSSAWTPRSATLQSSVFSVGQVGTDAREYAYRRAGECCGLAGWRICGDRSGALVRKGSRDL